MVHTGGSHSEHWANHLAESSGYEMKDNIGYETTGSLSRFGWYDNKIPVICTEERSGMDLDKTWDNFGPGLKRIFTEA